MIKVSLYEYSSFGYNYYILKNSSTTKTTLDYYNLVNRYITFIKDHDLRVTLSLLELYHWDVEFMKLAALNKGIKKTVQIDSKIHTKITDLIKKADLTLDAELNIMTGFILNEKRVTIEKLTSNISSIFSHVTFENLPPIARFDFEESGKCIAFDRYTASAFHSLRGTEDVLKYYYTLLTSKKPTETQTWYFFYSEIEKEVKNGNIKPSPPKELFRDLDSLRIFYRNKTQHPQLIYNSDEAQDLLFNCVKTVNQIVKDLKERKLINDDLSF